MLAVSHTYLQACVACLSVARQVGLPAGFDLHQLHHRLALRHIAAAENVSTTAAHTRSEHAEDSLTKLLGLQ